MVVGPEGADANLARVFGQLGDALTSSLDLRDLLRFIALDCGLDVRAEGDAIVFSKAD